MAVKSGAGASVSSGASYQARIGAYMIVSYLCDVESEMGCPKTLESISFETAETVDDINIINKSGETTYIQAKAIINYSIAPGSQFHAVLGQFAGQKHNQNDRLVLATTSRSSRKIVFELRAALEAFRTASTKAFFRDQPRALTEIVLELRIALQQIAKSGEAEATEAQVDEIIRRMTVLILDIEDNDPLERASVLLLEARQFIAAPAVWGKLISDCVGYSRTRKTVNFENLREDHDKFRTMADSLGSNAAKTFLQIEFQGSGFSVGREVTLCEVPPNDKGLPSGIAIIESYRFDEKGEERLAFADDKVIFGGHFEVPLIYRTSTFEGMKRAIKRHPELVGGNDVTICPINSDEDFEAGIFADIHRERLQAAIEKNDNPNRCLHCGKPVFSGEALLIELPPLLDPVVGMIHEECLKPSDRVTGIILSELFDKHPELIHFDVEGWYQSANGGQMAFSAFDIMPGTQHSPMIWGGSQPKGPEGGFVVEISLADGGREIVTKRNGVHRFSKEQADAFVEQLNAQFADAQSAGDPMCYTDESKAFSKRSILLTEIGNREKIRPVDHARTRAYDTKFAARYSKPGHWYAPVLYLRNRASGDPIMVEGVVLILTNPLKLASSIENWREAGVEIGDYETALLTSDAEFDEFMRWNEERGCIAVIDPLIDPATRNLAAGHLIGSSEMLLNVSTD